MSRWKKRKGKVVVPSHGGDFPTDPESRLEALLIALNTPKQVLILACLDSTWKSSRELWYEWQKLGSDHLPEPQGLSSRLEHSLIPNGFARMHSILYENTSRPVKRYKLSNAGSHYGKFASAFMLKYSVENKVSLSSILGGRSKRGPSNRMKLLKFIGQGMKSTKELMGQLNLDYSSLALHRSALQSYGFIDYESKFGVSPSSVQITQTGEIFLERLIEPIYALAEDRGNHIIESISSMQNDEQILRQYAVTGIELYCNASKGRRK